MKEFYTAIFLLFGLTALVVSAQEFKFYDGYDNTKSSLSARTVADSTDMERKKGKKGGKKGNGIGTDALGTDDFNEFYPDQNNVINSPVSPPLFPCDPPVCTILRDPLPANECENKCRTGSHCQGRKDTRVGEENIAVCVPD
jgi:hypothetical protein